MKARFKLGDRVLRGGEEYRITAIGPRHRRPDEEAWYSLGGGA
jgi:hypothetical protein